MGAHVRSGHRLAEGPESRLQLQEDLIAFGDQPAIEIKGRQHSARNTTQKPGLFAAVAAHRHLADAVRNPFELQPQPHLLAVRAPGVVIAVKGDANSAFLLAEQAKNRLGIGRPLRAVRFVSGQTLQV